MERKYTKEIIGFFGNLLLIILLACFITFLWAYVLAPITNNEPVNDYSSVIALGRFTMGLKLCAITYSSLMAVHTAFSKTLDKQTRVFNALHIAAVVLVIVGAQAIFVKSI